MARGRKVPFANWETTKPNGIEDRYIRNGNTFMLHEATMSLSHASFRVYQYMKLESGGAREFEFPYNKFKNIVSKDGFRRSLRELIDKGFIDVVERGSTTRKPNVYRFSTRWRGMT